MKPAASRFEACEQEIQARRLRKQESEQFDAQRYLNNQLEQEDIGPPDPLVLKLSAQEEARFNGTSSTSETPKEEPPAEAPPLPTPEQEAIWEAESNAAFAKLPPDKQAWCKQMEFQMDGFAMDFAASNGSVEEVLKKRADLEAARTAIPDAELEKCITQMQELNLRPGQREKGWRKELARANKHHKANFGTLLNHKQRQQLKFMWEKELEISTFSELKLRPENQMNWQKAWALASDLPSSTLEPPPNPTTAIAPTPVAKASIIDLKAPMSDSKGPTPGASQSSPALSEVLPTPPQPKTTAPTGEAKTGNQKSKSKAKKEKESKAAEVKSQKKAVAPTKNKKVKPTYTYEPVTDRPAPKDTSMAIVPTLPDGPPASRNTVRSMMAKASPVESAPADSASSSGDELDKFTRLRKSLLKAKRTLKSKVATVSGPTPNPPPAAASIPQALGPASIPPALRPASIPPAFAAGPNPQVMSDAPTPPTAPSIAFVPSQTMAVPSLITMPPLPEIPQVPSVPQSIVLSSSLGPSAEAPPNAVPKPIVVKREVDKELFASLAEVMKANEFQLSQAEFRTPLAPAANPKPKPKPATSLPMKPNTVAKGGDAKTSSAPLEPDSPPSKASSASSATRLGQSQRPQAIALSKSEQIKRSKALANASTPVPRNSSSTVARKARVIPPSRDVGVASQLVAYINSVRKRTPPAGCPSHRAAQDPFCHLCSSISS